MARIAPRTTSSRERIRAAERPYVIDMSFVLSASPDAVSAAYRQFQPRRPCRDHSRP